MRRWPVALTVLMAVLAAGCEEAVDITERPREVVREVKVARDPTPVFLSRRIPLADIERELADAVPASLGDLRRTDWDVLCESREVRVRRYRRGRREIVRRVRRVCQGARINGSIWRDGPARIGGDGGVLRIEVPIAYRFTVRGRGDARDREAKLEGKRVVRARVDVAFDETWKASARISDTLEWNEPPEVEALGSKFSFEGPVRKALKRRLRTIAETIQEALARNGEKMRALAEQGWRHLHYPVQLLEEPAIWLRGRPTAVRLAGVFLHDHALELRLAIMTRLETYVGERPVPLLAGALPALSPQAPVAERTRLSMPAFVPYEEVAAAAARGLVPGTRLRLEVLPEEVGVEVTGFEVAPADAGRIAIGARLALSLPERWGSVVGTAYVVARPVVARGETVLRLSRPGLAKPGAAPMLHRDGRFLLAGRAFPEAIAKAVAVDLGTRFRKALSRANAATSRPFGDRLWLNGSFDEVEVTAIVPQRDGIRIELSLVGELAIRADAAPAAAVTTTGALAR